MKRLIPLVLLGLLTDTVPASALIIDDTNIGISKMIPKEGDRVSWLVPVLNDSEEPFEGDATVNMRFARRGDRLGDPARQTMQLDLKPGESADFTFAWTAPRNGYYRIVFEVAPAGPCAVREIAVTKRDVYFVWFGAPREFRWCNVPTTVKPEDVEWWLRRGAIPASWKGGVCYKEWPVERFVDSWGAADWIAIDEIGGPGEITDKFIEAWKRLKQQKPEQWIAVWYMGAHAYWAEVKDLVDLFVPEIYLNYRGNHLGQFDTYLQVAREAGVMEQTIPGLGINQIKNKQGRVTNSPTKGDVLRQFRYLKRTAPELRGIGFFTASSAAWGVAEYADALCEEYFIKPVLTIQNIEHPVTVSGRPTDRKRVVTVTARNSGNMDASDVAVEWRWGWAEQRAELTEQRVPAWQVDEERVFEIEIAPQVGWAPIEFRIVPREGYTVLDGVATDYIVRPPDNLADAVPVLVPRGPDDPVTALRLAKLEADGPHRAVALSPEGTSLDLDVPCAALPSRPGLEEKLVAFQAPSTTNGPAMVLLEPGEAKTSALLEHSLEGSSLTVANAYYEATLDLSKDQLVALQPAGGAGSIFREPWRLEAVGHEGFAEAAIEELSGCLVVTVPYSSPKASGASQYVFFSYSPAIRIARSWVPKGEVTLKGAGDRCGLFQRGGTFALQPGVGGPMRRGRLQDGEKYRDLLFGYLGGRPLPGNADKAGWIDFSYGADDFDAGLGVAIEYRWQDTDMKSYDVTRLYDARDWLEVLYLWGKEKTFTRPQRSCLYLIPHRRLDFTDESITPPAKALWDQLHAWQLAVAGDK